MPESVQSLWIGQELGLLERLAIRSFLAQGIPYELYCYDKPYGVPEGTHLRNAAEIIPPEQIFTYRSGFGRGSYSAFSNVFRYRLLHDRGGWWVDTDVVCLRPFVFAEDYVFATELSDQGRVRAASCVIRSPAGAEYLKYCIDVCEGVDRDRLVWGQIGPQLIEDAQWRFGLTSYCTPVHFFNPVNYIDFGDLFADQFDFGRLDESYGVHLWRQMWISHGIGADPRLPADSLVGTLSRRFLGTRGRRGR